MHKIVCQQASPQTPLGELTAPPEPLAGLGVGPPGKRMEGGERKGGKVVPECPNPELASLPASLEPPS